MAELCRRYGVSRRTGYKWLQRYQQQGWAGLEDRSRAPRRHPLQTATAIEQEILALRAQHTRWGAITLQARQQRALDRFRQDYNEERPHQGLQLRTPSECYQGSGREYPSRLEEPEYPAVMEVRRVLDGRIRWRRQRVYVGKGLNGERVGLEAVGEGLWRVWFCFYELGLFDERELCLRPGTGPAAGHSSADGTGLRSPSGLPASGPILDEKCYLCAWHKVLPMSR